MTDSKAKTSKHNLLIILPTAFIILVMIFITAYFVTYLQQKKQYELQQEKTRDKILDDTLGCEFC